MSKQMKPISLSMDPALNDVLEKKAAARGLKKSDFVRQLLGYFALDKDDVKPVVLQIPKEALADRSLLKKWLEQKTDGLLNQFFPLPEVIKVEWGKPPTTNMLSPMPKR